MTLVEALNTIKCVGKVRLEGTKDWIYYFDTNSGEIMMYQPSNPKNTFVTYMNCYKPFTDQWELYRETFKGWAALEQLKAGKVLRSMKYPRYCYRLDPFSSSVQVSMDDGNFYSCMDFINYFLQSEFYVEAKS